jgi:hypothetical protein
MATPGYSCSHYKSRGNKPTKWTAIYAANEAGSKFIPYMVCDEGVRHGLGSSEFTTYQVAEAFYNLTRKK